MPLNPISHAIRQTAAAVKAGSPFQSEATAALTSFRSLRSKLERQVRAGRLTPRVAREQASQAAGELRERLTQRAHDQTSSAAVLLERITQSIERRRENAAKEPSLESLQRETNALLQRNLIEQQVANRRREFESRAFVGSLNGTAPAPTLESLLAFNAQAEAQRDEAAREWARRQLEAFRGFATTDEDMRRIDSACDRPAQVNPQIVGRYIEVVGGASPEERQRFVAEALRTRDASACVAAVLLADVELASDRESPASALIELLESMPEAALDALQAHYSAVTTAERAAALASAEAAASQAEIEARLPRLTPPTDDELARRLRAESRPLADSGQPIGLTLNFRGRSIDEKSVEELQDSE